MHTNWKLYFIQSNVYRLFYSCGWRCFLEDCVWSGNYFWSEFHCFSHTFGGGNDDLGTFVSNAKAWPWQIWSFGSRDDQKQSNIVTCMLGKYDHLALEISKGNVILWHVCWAKWYCDMFVEQSDIVRCILIISGLWQVLKFNEVKVNFKTFQNRPEKHLWSLILHSMNPEWLRTFPLTLWRGLPPFLDVGFLASLHSLWFVWGGHPF